LVNDGEATHDSGLKKLDFGVAFDVAIDVFDIDVLVE